MEHITVARTNWAKLLGCLYALPVLMVLSTHFVLGLSWVEMFDRERWLNARPFIGSPLLGKICSAIWVVGSVVITYRNIRAGGRYLTTSNDGLWILGQMKARKEQLRGNKLEFLKKRLTRTLRTSDGRISLNVSYADVDLALLRDVLRNQFDCDLKCAN